MRAWLVLLIACLAASMAAGVTIMERSQACSRAEQALQSLGWSYGKPTTASTMAPGKPFGTFGWSWFVEFGGRAYARYDAITGELVELSNTEAFMALPSHESPELPEAEVRGLALRYLGILGGASDLRLTRVQQHPSAGWILRWARVYQGIPFTDDGAMVAVARDGTLLSYFRTFLRQPPENTRANITREQAIAIAKRAVTEADVPAQLLTKPMQAELYIAPREPSRRTVPPTPETAVVWVVGYGSAEDLGRAYVYVDANTGLVSLLERGSILPVSKPAPTDKAD